MLPNWSKSEDWRGDARYAAMLVKLVIEYHRVVSLERNITIEMLSSDNGFMNYHPFYFTQRTLLTRYD